MDAREKEDQAEAREEKIIKSEAARRSRAENTERKQREQIAELEYRFRQFIRASEDSSPEEEEED